jgi:putative two-component system response regulator
MVRSMDSPRSDADSAGARILIVEDEPRVCGTLARYLSRTGYQVQTAACVPEALARMRLDRFETLVVDLRLPGGSGMDILTEARLRSPDTRFILMSGNAEFADAAAAVQQRIDAILQKPFDLAEMGARVDESVARYRAAGSAAAERARLEARVRQRDHESKLWVLRAAHSLAHAVEAKDPYTAGHAQRVTAYAVCMGRACGGIDLEQFRLAGQLHDVGKIGVPDVVLNKPAPLTAEEFDLVRQHPAAGWRILEPLIDDPLVIGVVRWHHERWDGGGYPDGLRGPDIPLPARIIAVADTLDAMTSHRSYRSALPWSAAVAEIRRGDGTQFDPAVVALFEEVLPELESLFREDDFPELEQHGC